MHILVVTETYPPEINGVARTLAELVGGLRTRGHTLSLVLPRRRAGTATSVVVESGLVHHEVKGLPLPGYPELQFGLPSRGLFERLLRTQRFHAAYIATEGPLGYAALRACERHGVATLSGMHTNFHQYSRHYHVGLIAPLLLRYLRHFHNRVDATLVPTTAMAAALFEQGFERLRVWPRGVHAQQFDPRHRRAELRAAWGLGDDDLGVLHVGRLAAEKNIDAVFTAFAAIRARRPEARLIVVGGGPIERQLRARHPDTLFAGPRTVRDLAEHYASADMFLFPSKTETFGNVTLEAMASGLAVVAFDLAAAHELIRHGHNGLLADADDDAGFVHQACRCTEDDDLRLQMKRHARETALQQDWPRLILELERLFVDCGTEGRDDDLEDAVRTSERP